MGVLTSIGEFLNTYGWLGVTILIIAGGMWKLYVFRWTYQEKADDAKFWRDLYLSSAEKTDKAIDTLATTVTMLQNQSQGQSPSRRRE